MRTQGTWQIFSLITKLASVAITTLQNIIILKILSVADYGLIGIVLSVASIIGVSQNLGLGTATTREVAGIDDLKKTQQIVIVSILTRLAVSIPLMVLLFFGASIIAKNVYNYPQITLPLQIMAIVFMFHGVRGVISSALRGMKLFSFVFMLDIISALVSIVLYMIFIDRFGFIGYFYANITLIILVTAVLALYLLKVFGMPIQLPNRREFKDIFRSIWGLSMAEYVSRLVNSAWQRSSLLIVGLFVPKESLGFLNFSLDYGSKLTAASDAINTVNLSVMSELFIKNRNAFNAKLKKSFNREIAFLLVSSFLAIVFAPEIIEVIFQTKYQSSIAIVPLAVLAYLLFAIYDVLRTEVLLAANQQRHIMSTSIIMVVVTLVVSSILSYVTGKPESALWGMLCGALVGVGMILYSSYTEWGIILIYKNNILPSFSLLPLLLLSGSSATIGVKSTVTFVCIGIYAWLLEYWKVVDVSRILNNGYVKSKDVAYSILLKRSNK